MSHPIHAQTVLGDVRLKVTSLDRSIRFYQDIVGFKLLDRHGDVAQLTVDGVNPLLVIEEVPDAVIVQERSATGLYHFAILVPDREQLGFSLRNLLRNGVRFGQADHLVSEALYLSDPDHNGIEIYRDRPRSTWKRDSDNNIAMASDPLDLDAILTEAGDKPWAGLHAETVIGHIHLHIGDLNQAKAFYCDILGFEIVFDASRMMRALFVSAGGYHHHIGLNVWAGVGAPQPPANGTGLAHFTVVLPSAEALASTLTTLRDAGITINEQDGGAFVRDPWGIKIRLISG